MNKLSNYWFDFIKQEINKDYFRKIEDALIKCEYYPSNNKIFEAFKLTSFEDTKVVIFGQDPYHEEGQAHGLAFSVLNNKPPRSLINLFKEIKSDTGKIRTNANLTDWANQGVLLLNITLTVKQHEARSHKKIGWDQFNKAVIDELNKKEKPIVFILMGNDAKEKAKYISNKHYIIKCVHPSPLSASRGFFNSKIFTKTNKILRELNEKEIKWWD